MNLLAQATQPAGGSWSGIRFLDNSPWQWLALLAVLIGTLVAGRLVRFLLSRDSRWAAGHPWAQWLHRVLRCLAGPSAMLIFAAGLYAASLFMNLALSDGFDIRHFWVAVCKTLAALAVGWAAYRLVEVLEAIIRPWTEGAATLLGLQLVPLIRKAVRVFIVIILALFIAQNIFQWEIGPLLAGMGLGGLALALAAQDALKNFFGSVAILADQPFKLGERIQFENYDGTVEEVGLRSTRIRLLEGPVVAVPNSKLADVAITNIAKRPFIRRTLNVTITYSTPPDKVQRGVQILREMLEARKAAFPPDLPPRVYFNEFNADSLNLIVYYWFAPPEWWQFLAFNHDFNMELLRRFNEERIEFAFPTRTLYLKQDSPIAADIRLDKPSE